MKIKLLFASLAIAVTAFAQGPAGPNLTVKNGTAAVSTLPCNDSVLVGSVYTQITNPSVTLLCSQTGASTLGQGAFGWLPIQTSASGGGGSVVIAAGKTFTVNNSLTLAGTDGTTMTFPGTSDTVVTLGAAQTLTSKTFTAPVIATISNTGTETLPSTTGGLPVVIYCGATSGATANCANTATGATAKVYAGVATLSSNASVITISPGFTATGDYSCTGNDVTTRANPVQVVPTSATTFTITNTTGASDVVNWTCVGY